MQKYEDTTKDTLADEDTNYENCQSEYICDEIKVDTKKSRPYFENAWILDPNCKNKSIENLFTVIIIIKNVSTAQNIISHIRQKYQQVQIIVGLPDKNFVTNSWIFYKDENISTIKLNIQENENWIQLIQHVKTKYVFIGYKLRKWHKSNNFGNFERMLRFLHSGLKNRK